MGAGGHCRWNLFIYSSDVLPPVYRINVIIQDRAWCEVCLDYSCIGLHAVTQGQHKTQRKANCKHSGFLFNQTNALSVKIQEMYHIQKLL